MGWLDVFDFIGDVAEKTFDIATKPILVVADGIDMLTGQSSSGGGSSSRSYSNRDEIEEEERQDNRDGLQRDIEKYKNESIKNIKYRYGVEITFDDAVHKIVKRNATNLDHIKTLEKEIAEIETLVNQLKKGDYDSIAC